MSASRVAKPNRAGNAASRNFAPVFETLEPRILLDAIYEVEPNGSRASSDSLVFDSEYLAIAYGRNPTPSDHDYFSFTTPSFTGTRLLSATMKPTSADGELDAKIILKSSSSDLKTVNSYSDGVPETLTYQVSGKRTYYIDCTNADWTTVGEGNYTLVLSLTPQYRIDSVNRDNENDYNHNGYLCQFGLDYHVVRDWGTASVYAKVFVDTTYPDETLLGKTGDFDVSPSSWGGFRVSCNRPELARGSHDFRIRIYLSGTDTEVASATEWDWSALLDVRTENFAEEINQIRITGPTKVMEKEVNQFHCMVDYNDGVTSRDYTEFVDWSENSPYATIGTYSNPPAGQLTTYDVAGQEQVTISASWPLYGKTFTDTHSVAILDTPFIWIGDVSQYEGNSGTAAFSFTISLSGESTKTVSAHIGTEDGTATVAGGDYQPTDPSAWLEWLPGSTNDKHLIVKVNGDTTIESDEEFYVVLCRLSNADPGRTRATGGILNDDYDTTAPTPNPSTWSTVPYATGPNSIMMVATTASDPSGVRYYFDETSGNPGGSDSEWQETPDYEDTGLLPGTTYTYQVRTRDNSSNQNPGSWSQPASATTDNPLVSIEASDADAGEPANNGSFRVTRSGGVNGTLRVYYTTTGTATGGRDYAALPGYVDISNGSASALVPVIVVDDALDEDTEIARASLSANASYSIDPAKSSATVTISDDDPLPSLTINDVQVIEGNSGTVNAVFTVSLNTASGRTVTVNYATADGTGVAPGDYTAASETLTFIPGETSKQVPVEVKGDTTIEADEKFYVNLSGANNATIADGQGVGTIRNDDFGNLAWEVAGTGDFDNNGSSDLLCWDRNTGALGAWLMTNGQVTSWKRMGTVSYADWEVGGVGDFDHNGYADILWRNKTTGRTGAWLMTNGQFTSWKGIGTASYTDWEIGGVGDLDKNGYADIVWRNKTTGGTGAWLMTNGQITSWLGVGRAFYSDWALCGLGHFDGNGYLDILWHNKTTGLVGAWLLDNGHYQRWKPIGIVL